MLVQLNWFVLSFYNLLLGRCLSTSKSENSFVLSMRLIKKLKNDSVFARKKYCVYCSSYVRQNLRVRCSLNFEFGTYDVIKCIFVFFNVNKVTRHVNYTCLLF